MPKVENEFMTADIEEEETMLSEEEQKQELLENEDAMLQALFDSADYVKGETRTFEITRYGKVYFTFTVTPLSEAMVTDIRKKYTRYTKNKRMGTKVAEEVDTPKYKSSLIYNSTIPEDKERIWDNRRLWEGLRKKGINIVNALDVVDAILLPGEKTMIIEELDNLSGYDENSQIETVKN